MVKHAMCNLFFHISLKVYLGIQCFFIVLPFGFCCYPILEKRRKKTAKLCLYCMKAGRQAGRQAGNMYPGWKAFVIESFFFWFSLQIIISSPCRATETYVIAFWSLFAPFLTHNLINFGTFLTREKCTKTEMCASGIVSICRIDMIAQMFHSNWNESISWCSDRMYIYSWNNETALSDAIHCAVYDSSRL